MAGTAIDGRGTLMRQLGIRMPASTVKTPAEPLSKKDSLRHLASHKGKGEVAEALQQISGDKADRITGAKTLARLKPVQAFGPLLTATLRESDDEVKLEFLKALRAITDANLEGSPQVFPPAFEKAIGPMKNIVLTAKLPLATEAVWILYGCADDKTSEAVLRALRDNVSPGTPIHQEIGRAVGRILCID
jgi:hypothetical protein